MFPPTEDMIKPRAIIDYKQDQVNQQNKILLFFFPESLSSNFKIFAVSVSRLSVSGDDPRYQGFSSEGKRFPGNEVMGTSENGHKRLTVGEVVD